MRTCLCPNCHSRRVRCYPGLDRSVTSRELNVRGVARTWSTVERLSTFSGGCLEEPARLGSRTTMSNIMAGACATPSHDSFWTDISKRREGLLVLLAKGMHMGCMISHKRLSFTTCSISTGLSQMNCQHSRQRCTDLSLLITAMPVSSFSSPAAGVVWEF